MDAWNGTTRTRRTTCSTRIVSLVVCSGTADTASAARGKKVKFSTSRTEERLKSEMCCLVVWLLLV